MSQSKWSLLRRRLIAIDVSFSFRIHTFFQFLPRSVLRFLEFSGDGRFWFPVVFGYFLSPLSSTSPHFRSVLLPLLLGSVFDLLLIGLIKYLVRRPRPVYNKEMCLTVAVDYWSFPSGHSSRVFFIACCLYFSLASLEKTIEQLGYFTGNVSAADLGWYFVLIIFFWSTATSFSRVLLGRHFVLDVTAGACLGIAEALIVTCFVERLGLFPG